MIKIIPFILTLLVIIVSNIFFTGIILAVDTWEFNQSVPPSSNVRCNYSIQNSVHGVPFAFYGGWNTGSGCGAGSYFNKSALGFNIASWLIILAASYIISFRANRARSSNPQIGNSQM